MTPKPTGNGHPNIVPYDVYQTATCPLFVAVANDRLFGRLCEALGIGELAADERFATNRQRVNHRDALNAALSKAFAAVDGESFGKQLLAHSVPAALILTIAEVAQAPHTVHRQMVVKQDDYVGPGIPIKLMGTPASVRTGPPALGSLKATGEDVEPVWKE